VATKRRAKGKASKGSPRPPGRPTKLTAELKEAICEAVRGGNYIETAAAMCGVSKQVLYTWMKAGARDEDAAHVAFLDAVRKAQADAEGRNVALIAKAGQTQWQASAWFLERSQPKKWGLRVRVHVVEELSGFLEELSRVLPEEWFEKVLEVAAARVGGEAAGAEASDEGAGAAPADDAGRVGDAHPRAVGEGVREAAAPGPAAG
jgi:hypothetical protein